MKPVSKSSRLDKTITSIINRFGPELVGLCIGVLLSGTIFWFIARTYYLPSYEITENIQSDQQDTVTHSEVHIEDNPTTPTVSSIPAVSIETTTVPTPTPTPTNVSQKININTASLSELERLPGIGPVLGQRIIDGRPYTSITAIQQVSGIGVKTYAKIKDSITIE